MDSADPSTELDFLNFYVHWSYTGISQKNDVHVEEILLPQLLEGRPEMLTDSCCQRCRKEATMSRCIVRLVPFALIQDDSYSF